MQKKLACILLTISIQLCCLSVLAYASSASSEGSVATCSVGHEVCLGDEYSHRTFSSLSEAKATFGYEFTYKPCAALHDDSYYNYYYSLACGDKVFFYVNLDDGSDVWFIPDPDSETE